MSDGASERMNALHGFAHTPIAVFELMGTTEETKGPSTPVVADPDGNAREPDPFSN